MDGHGALAVVRTLETYVVFKIFADNLQHLEVLVRQLLDFILLFRLLLSELLQFFFQLAYGEILLDDQVAKIFLKIVR